MKKKPESNPDPVARREALASDVEKFLQSGKEIEQIPSGVSSYSPQGPVKSLNAQKGAQVKANEAKANDAKAEEAKPEEAKPEEAKAVEAKA